MTIFKIIWTLWIVSEILLNRLLRSKDKSLKNHDKGTLRIIWITIVIAVLAGVTFSNIYRILISNSLTIQYVGLFLIVFGMVFRFISIWTLGKFFTVDISIFKDHKIKKDGFYKFIRHPSYLGSLISFAGLGLSINNWISFFVILIPVAWSFLNRIQAEEKMLVNQFGNAYLEYIKKTKRLIPFIY